MKKHEWKKFLSYYKPYKKIFAADMLFACMGAAVTLIIPLIIRYITSDVIYRDSSQSLHRILVLTGIMALLVLLECYCNYFIAYYGHMMGAKMEYNMRNEILHITKNCPLAFLTIKK